MALITTVALQINLFLVGAEIFTDFYFRTEHVAAATYLYLGLERREQARTVDLDRHPPGRSGRDHADLHPLRRRRVFLSIACVLAIVGVWIEKGMGLVVPGFVPTPLGEVFEYSPQWGEVFVSAGNLGAGHADLHHSWRRSAIPIELGQLRRPAASLPPAAP